MFDTVYSFEVVSPLHCTALVIITLHSEFIVLLRAAVYCTGRHSIGHWCMNWYVFFWIPYWPIPKRWKVVLNTSSCQKDGGPTRSIFSCRAKYCGMTWTTNHNLLPVYYMFLQYFWYCWLGLLTCKNRLPYNLYCVGGDVKHCSIQSNPINKRAAVHRSVSESWQAR